MTPTNRRMHLGWAALLGLAIVAVFAVYRINQLHQHLISDRVELIEQKVQEVELLVDSYRKMSLQGTMSSELARQAALLVIGNMRFGDNDYFWVVDYDSRFVMHPIDPTLVGSRIKSVDTRDGLSLAEKIPQLLKHRGRGLIYYLWPKPGRTEPVEKISYVAGFEPWGWGLGTGVYVDDINAMFWQEMMDLMTVVAVLLLILLLFWYGFSQAALLQPISRADK